jgi:predicted negative regulator of RcsB-dependent stress response
MNTILHGREKFYVFKNYLIMNKKILCLVTVVAIAMTTGWNVMQSRNETVLSNVALANMEALADENASDHCSTYCEEWPLTYCVLETSTSYIYCMEKYPKCY